MRIPSLPSWLLTALALPALAHAAPRERGSFDALSARPRVATRASVLDGATGLSAEHASSVDERFGVPTFLWVQPVAPGAQAYVPVKTPEAAARAHLARYGSLYRLGSQDLPTLVWGVVHDTGEGGLIVRFRQEVDGIPVFRDEVKVLMDRSFGLQAISGYVTGAPSHARSGFKLTAEQAVSKAAAALELAAAPEAVVSDGAGEGGYAMWTLKGEGFAHPARTRAVWFHFPERLEAAFYVELHLDPGGERQTIDEGLVISAETGAVLFVKPLTHQDVFQYRVWADTQGAHRPWDGPEGTAPSPLPNPHVNSGYTPPYVLPNLIALQNGPISTNDPWLLPNATVTDGNNVVAYVDLFSPDGYSPTRGDFKATLTDAGTFDRTYDPTLGPKSSQSQQMAAVTQMFFNNNFFHDWYYDVGFQEQDGNAQKDNYGRGGVARDPILAEGQDYSGTDNANMQVPPDGSSPVMQMYTWSGAASATLTLSPGNTTPYFAAALFGLGAYNLSAAVVLVNSGTDHLGCVAPSNNLTGKVALVERGTCTFESKASLVQAAGAVALIVADNVAGEQAFSMQGSGRAGGPNITIPAGMISLADGTALETALGQHSVTATLSRTATVDHDGTIDNSVMAHEWGHYISNRLIGDAMGLGTDFSNGLGEGWADTHAMALVVRQEDTLEPTNTLWDGVYALASYATSGADLQNAYYFGVRRVPYSTRIEIDPLTYKHTSDGVAITGAPVAYGSDGSFNTEVHSEGEVWATMLWECYAAMLRDTLGTTPRFTFDEAQRRWRGYLVAGYKLTPNDPTLLEARDAILSAMYARDPIDFGLCQAGFAKRGAGLRAVAPDRFDQSQSGVIEDFHAGNDVQVVTASLTDDFDSCDHDGVLDNGETAMLTVVVHNGGATPLQAPTVTVTSTNPHVSFPQGATASVPALLPFHNATVKVPVALAGATGAESLSLVVTAADPSVTLAPQPYTVTVSANQDEVQAASASDDVEASSSVWQPGADQRFAVNLAWSRIAVGDGHRWFGPDDGQAPSLLWLRSPPLDVAPTGDFSFTFKHRYGFEYDPSRGGTAYDGSVIEISTDDGMTWTDIGASATPGYTGTIFSQSGNPLANRQAFTRRNPSWPNLDAVTVSLGTAYQGRTVKVRFAVGSDAAATDYGWDVDDIAFQGITNTPFTQVVADRHQCFGQHPLAVVAADLDLYSGGTGYLDGTQSRGLGTLSGLWLQTAGPRGIVRDPQALRTQVTAPVVSSDVDLAFSLTVFDAGLASLTPAVQHVHVHAGARPTGSSSSSGSTSTGSSSSSGSTGGITGTSSSSGSGSGSTGLHNTVGGNTDGTVGSSTSTGGSSPQDPGGCGCGASALPISPEVALFVLAGLSQRKRRRFGLGRRPR